jgi:hypothetical protein
MAGRVTEVVAWSGCGNFPLGHCDRPAIGSAARFAMAIIRIPMLRSVWLLSEQPVPCSVASDILVGGTVHMLAPQRISFFARFSLILTWHIRHHALFQQSFAAGQAPTVFYYQLSLPTVFTTYHLPVPLVATTKAILNYPNLSQIHFATLASFARNGLRRQSFHISPCPTQRRLF